MVAEERIQEIAERIADLAIEKRKLLYTCKGKPEPFVKGVIDNSLLITSTELRSGEKAVVKKSESVLSDENLLKWFTKHGIVRIGKKGSIFYFMPFGYLDELTKEMAAGSKERVDSGPFQSKLNQNADKISARQFQFTLIFGKLETKKGCGLSDEEVYSILNNFSQDKHGRYKSKILKGLTDLGFIILYDDNKYRMLTAPRLKFLKTKCTLVQKISKEEILSIIENYYSASVGMLTVDTLYSLVKKKKKKIGIKIPPKLLEKHLRELESEGKIVIVQRGKHSNIIAPKGYEYYFDTSTRFNRGLKARLQETLENYGSGQYDLVLAIEKARVQCSELPDLRTVVIILSNYFSNLKDVRYFIEKYEEASDNFRGRDNRRYYISLIEQFTSEHDCTNRKIFLEEYFGVQGIRNSAARYYIWVDLLKKKFDKDPHKIIFINFKD